MANSPDTLNAIIPSSVDELINKSIAEMSHELSKYYGTNLQFLSPNNMSFIITVALCARVFDLYQTLKYSIRNLLLPYASGEFLDIYGTNKGVFRGMAANASGRVVLEANDVSKELLAGTKLKDSKDNLFSVQTTVYSQLVELVVTSLVVYGNKATVTVELPSGWSDLGLYTGQTINISGVPDLLFNGQKTITVNNYNTFQFDVPYATPTPSSSDGGIVSFMAAFPSVVSDLPSAAANVSASSPLTLVETSDDFESVGYACFSGVKGGSDGEGDAEYAARVQFKYQNPMTTLGEADVEFKLMDADAQLSILKIKRGYPADGSTTILCGYSGMTASERSIPSEVLTTYTDLIFDKTYVGILPSELIFNNFTYTPLDIEVTDLIPNDADLKATIRQNLENYFKSLSYGIGVKLADLLAAVSTSTSLSGLQPLSFNIGAPLADVAVGEDEIVVAGTITVVG